VNELANARERPDFQFAKALGQIFIHEVLRPSYPRMDRMDYASYQQKIEKTYLNELESKYSRLPPWIKATWKRLLAPTQ
jgi:hypothetical protein